MVGEASQVRSAKQKFSTAQLRYFSKIWNPKLSRFLAGSASSANLPISLKLSSLQKKLTKTYNQESDLSLLLRPFPCAKSPDVPQ